MHTTCIQFGYDMPKTMATSRMHYGHSMPTACLQQEYSMVEVGWKYT